MNKPATADYDEPVSDYADVMTVEEFIGCCDVGAFIDYDGFGHPVKGDAMAGDLEIKPSRSGLIPADATHVAWYNR